MLYFSKRRHWSSPKNWMKEQFQLSDFLQCVILNVWEYLRFPSSENLTYSSGEICALVQVFFIGLNYLAWTIWYQQLWVPRWPGDFSSSFLLLLKGHFIFPDSLNFFSECTFSIWQNLRVFSVVALPRGRSNR